MPLRLHFDAGSATGVEQLIKDAGAFTCSWSYPYPVSHVQKKVDRLDWRFRIRRWIGMTFGIGF